MAVPHRLSAFVAALGLVAASCSAAAGGQAAVTVRQWEVWVTDPGRLPANGAWVSQGVTAAGSGQVVVVDPTVAYQEIDGFGAALTDSSAWLIAGHDTDTLMRRLFDERDGIGISLLRQPIGSTDYTTRGFYTYDDEGGDGTFSIEGDLAYIVPLLVEARGLSPELGVIASAWSAPSWMKTNGALADGTLDPDAYADYAEYVRRFVEAYRGAGVPVEAVTPGTEPVSWMKGEAPHMTMTRQDQLELVRDHLGPALATLEPRPSLLIYDDNVASGHPAFGGYPELLLADPALSGLVHGVAVHCYFGGLEDLSGWHAQFPGMRSYLTECSSGIEDGAYDGRMVDALIDSVRHGAAGAVLWNAVLDETHGPYVDGCDGRCTPLITVRSDGTIEYHLDYFALGHLSRFVRSGAHRVAATEVPGLNSVAFANPDGSIVVVAHDRSETARPVLVGVGDRAVEFELPAGGIATAVMRA